MTIIFRRVTGPAIAGLLLACASSPRVDSAARVQPSPPQPETPWVVGGGSTTHTLDTSGVVTAPGGATVRLRAREANAPNASLVKSTPAAVLRMKRVRLSGSIRTVNVTQASLWLRVDSPTGTLLLDNGVDRALRGTQDWTTFSVTLPVTLSASRLVFGVLMGGGGEVEVRDLRIEAVGVLDATAPLHPDAKVLVDSAISVARTRSVWRDTLSWKEIIPEVRQLAAGAASAADAFPALRFLATRLGDRHSSFMAPTSASAFQSGGSQNPVPVVELSSERVGYINIPSYGGGEQSAIIKYSNTVHAQLIKLLPAVSCGWVIDLRQNPGGNMYPMLAALRPFLGDSALGYFVAGTMKSPWTATMSPAPKHPRGLDALEKAHVAVITGPRTMSSGEIVAISFRGRSRTRSFGLPTGGYSTANSMIPLPGGARFNITTAIDADRNGRLFGHAIDPDERVESADSTGDAALDRARTWLMKETRCGDKR